MNTQQSLTVHGGGGVERVGGVAHAVVPTPEARVPAIVLQAAQEHAGVTGTPEFAPLTSQALVPTDLIYPGSPTFALPTFGLPD